MQFQWPEQSLLQVILKYALVISAFDIARMNFEIFPLGNEFLRWQCPLYPLLIYDLDTHEKL